MDDMEAMEVGGLVPDPPESEEQHSVDGGLPETRLHHKAYARLVGALRTGAKSARREAHRIKCNTRSWFADLRYELLRKPESPRAQYNQVAGNLVIMQSILDKRTPF